MSEECWEIPSITDVPEFLRAVFEQTPTPVTVSFEISRPTSEVNAVFLRHRSNAGYRPWRDTIFPRTRVYFCDLDRALISDLTDLLKSREPSTVFWHIKGFIEGNLVFYFHDADIGESALLSPKLSSATVRAISSYIKRTPLRIESDIDWDADWKVSTKTKKSRSA